MYRKNRIKKTTLKVNNSYEGETIEQKIQRLLSNKEPITEGAPLIYTDRKEGIIAAHNIKTDRWEIAIEAMSEVDKSYKAKRAERMMPKEADKETGQKAIEGMAKEGGQTQTTAEGKA